MYISVKVYLHNGTFCYKNYFKIIKLKSIKLICVHSVIGRRRNNPMENEIRIFTCEALSDVILQSGAFASNLT